MKTRFQLSNPHSTNRDSQKIQSNVIYALKSMCKNLHLKRSSSHPHKFRPSRICSCPPNQCSPLALDFPLSTSRHLTKTNRRWKKERKMVARRMKITCSSLNTVLFLIICLVIMNNYFVEILFVCLLLFVYVCLFDQR